MLLWLAAGALLSYLVQRILVSRGPLSSKLKFLSGVMSFALTGALAWWLFDVPGLVRQQQAIANWETTRSLPEYNPVVELNGRTLAFIAGAGALALGLVMLVRPEVYLKDSSVEVAVSRAVGSRPASRHGVLKRFRVYGAIIALGGLVALWAGITGF